MTIGGARVATESTFGVVNPATAEVFCQAPDCSRQQLDDAMESAQKAFGDWRTDLETRRKALLAASELLFGAASDLAPLLTNEQGKPLADATGEVFGGGGWFKYF